MTAQERYRLHDAIQAIVIGLPDQAFQRTDTRARTLDVVGHDQGRRLGHGQIQVIGFVVTQCVVEEVDDRIDLTFTQQVERVLLHGTK
ncbi:hypothetical protein D3C75_1194330 [compost metagenome]